MADVITSIGSRSSEGITVSSVTGTGPYTVNLSAATTDTDIGDLMTDFFFNAYRITGVSGSTLTVVDDQGAGAGPTTGSGNTTRLYSSIANWIADLNDTTQYSSGDHAIGELHDDADFAETNLDLDGGATPGLSQRTLRAHSGSVHDGTAANGATLDASGGGHGLEVSGNNIDTDIEDFIIKDWGGGSTAKTGLYFRTNNSGPDHARRMILDAGTSPHSTARGFNFERDNKYILNCIALNCSASTREGVRNSTWDSIFVYNTTVYNCDVGVDAGNATTDMDCRNVISVGNTTDYTGTFHTSTDYCIDSDGSDPNTGANNINSVTVANQFVSTTGGSEDLHMQDSAADGFEAGTDLGTSPTGVEIDIDGRDRDAQGDTWCIGHHQFVSAGADPALIPSRIATRVPVDPTFAYQW